MGKKIWMVILFVVCSVGIVYTKPQTTYADISYVDAVEGNTQAGYHVVKISKSSMENDPMCKALQNALDEAKLYAAEDLKYKVIVEPGTYALSTCIHAYSNTYLSLQGVTFQHKNYSGNMFKIGDIGGDGDTVSGYHYKNITVDGGTWDGFGITSPIMKAAHAENVVIKNASLKNVKDSHVVEVAAINGFEVSGCTFSDQTASNEKKEALLANEVIQLDLLVQGHFSGYKYEALDMKNVVISNNIFNHVLRGVGSHTAYSKRSTDHVVIKENTFENVKSVAIECYNYTDCTISNNRMTECGRGIAVYAMRSNANGAFNAAATKGNELNAKTVITNNVISVKNTDTYPPTGISVEGLDLKAATHGTGEKTAAGNYYISWVSVLNNEINTPGHGIVLNDAYNSSVGNNKITGTTGSGSYYGISVDNASKGIQVTGNTIDKTGLNGILITGKSDAGLVAGNCVTNAGSNAVCVNSASVGTIKDNVLNQSGTCGIQLSRNAKCKKAISGNKITNANGRGIYIYDKSTVKAIDNNTIKGIKLQGINISSLKNAVSISNNNISKCKNHVIYIKTPTKYQVKLLNNQIKAVKNQNGIQVTAGQVRIEDNAISGANWPVSIEIGVKGEVGSNRYKGNVNNLAYIRGSKKSIRTAGLKKVVLKVSKTSKSIKLSWKKVKGASGYEIYRASSVNGKYKKIAEAGKKYQYTDKKVKAGRTYYYKVRAVSGDKKSKMRIFGTYSKAVKGSC